MTRLGILAPLALLLLSNAPDNDDPVPTPVPPAFATAERGLTFRTPPGSTYCPLGDDWVGSDHGTVVYLAPPRHCVRYASEHVSYRDLDPADTPRIYFSYEYRDDEEGPIPDCKHSIGTIMLLGSPRRVCSDPGKTLSYSVTAPYMADTTSTLTLTLITSPRTPRCRSRYTPRDGGKHRDLLVGLAFRRRARQPRRPGRDHGCRTALPQGCAILLIRSFPIAPHKLWFD